MLKVKGEAYKYCFHNMDIAEVKIEYCNPSESVKTQRRIVSASKRYSERNKGFKIKSKNKGHYIEYTRIK